MAPSYKQEATNEVFDVPFQEIDIPPVPTGLYSFLEKVWFAFVNKTVSFSFLKGGYCFDHAVFEAISENSLRIVVSASRLAMKEVGKGSSPASFKEFISKTKLIHFDSYHNGSANIIRQAIIDTGNGKLPRVTAFNLKKDTKIIHPEVRKILTDEMNYGACIPLFVNNIPIGLLWGIRDKGISKSQLKEITWRLHALFDGVSTIISDEMSGLKNDFLTRRNIEKLDANARIENVIHRNQGKNRPILKSIFAYSHKYKIKYRLDTSYIIPTSQGFNIDVKQYLPEERNNIGKNILLIPGFFCNRSCLDRLAREMAFRHGYNVFSLNVRGRSTLTLPANKKYPDWTVDDLIHEDFPTALLWIKKKYPKEQTIVIGHSMGGMIPKFYSSSYDEIKSVFKKKNMPDPNEYIAGIMDITSPNYIHVDFKIPGFKEIVGGARLVSSNFIGDKLLRIFTGLFPRYVKTIDLNRFLALLHNLLDGTKGFSFSIKDRIPTVSDFMGYEEITPPEWYFLMENVFCEESVKVILQFVYSQIDKNKFYSFHREINYTENLSNLKMPIYSIIGTKDAIAPGDSIQTDFDRIPSTNKKVSEYAQGHLGIIMHRPTIKDIANNANKWIKSI